MERVEAAIKRMAGLAFPRDPGLAEREAFLETPEARRIPIEEFEKRFGITEVSVPPGYFSSYYSVDDDPRERERKRQNLENFMNEGAPAELKGQE